LVLITDLIMLCITNLFYVINIMKTNEYHSEPLNEIQSLNVIKKMIRVSRQKLKNDSILFIVWGWIFFINYFFLNYLTHILFITNQALRIVRYLRVILPVIGIVYTLYYMLQQRKRVQTYIGSSLRYVWISLIVCFILVNLIQNNVLHSINFELQHPIFMVLIAFAITVTGGILRYRLIIGGGIIFGILALVASYFKLHEQLLIESIAWLIAFVIPGHILYSKRKS